MADSEFLSGNKNKLMSVVELEFVEEAYKMIPRPMEMLD